jgi:hypothetical protein
MGGKNELRVVIQLFLLASGKRKKIRYGVQTIVYF